MPHTHPHALLIVLTVAAIAPLLVGAGILSVLIYPLAALSLRTRIRPHGSG
jgi:hypothetical protein